MKNNIFSFCASSFILYCAIFLQPIFLLVPQNVFAQNTTIIPKVSSSDVYVFHAVSDLKSPSANAGVDLIAKLGKFPERVHLVNLLDAQVTQSALGRLSAAVAAGKDVYALVFISGHSCYEQGIIPFFSRPKFIIDIVDAQGEHALNPLDFLSRIAEISPPQCGTAPVVDMFVNGCEAGTLQKLVLRLPGAGKQGLPVNIYTPNTGRGAAFENLTSVYLEKMPNELRRALVPLLQQGGAVGADIHDVVAGAFQRARDYELGSGKSKNNPHVVELPGSCGVPRVGGGGGLKGPGGILPGGIHLDPGMGDGGTGGVSPGGGNGLTITPGGGSGVGGAGTVAGGGLTVGPSLGNGTLGLSCVTNGAEIEDIFNPMKGLDLFDPEAILQLENTLGHPLTFDEFWNPADVDLINRLDPVKVEVIFDSARGRALIIEVTRDAYGVITSRTPRGYIPIDNIDAARAAIDVRFPGGRVSSCSPLGNSTKGTWFPSANATCVDYEVRAAQQLFPEEVLDLIDSKKLEVLNLLPDKPLMSQLKGRQLLDLIRGNVEVTSLSGEEFLNAFFEERTFVTRGRSYTVRVYKGTKPLLKLPGSFYRPGDQLGYEKDIYFGKTGEFVPPEPGPVCPSRTPIAPKTPIPCSPSPAPVMASPEVLVAQHDVVQLRGEVFAMRRQLAAEAQQQHIPLANKLAASPEYQAQLAAFQHAQTILKSLQQVCPNKSIATGGSPNPPAPPAPPVTPDAGGSSVIVEPAACAEPEAVRELSSRLKTLQEQIDNFDEKINAWQDAIHDFGQPGGEAERLRKRIEKFKGQLAAAENALTEARGRLARRLGQPGWENSLQAFEVRDRVQDLNDLQYGIAEAADKLQHGQARLQDEIDHGKARRVAEASALQAEIDGLMGRKPCVAPPELPGGGTGGAGGNGTGSGGGQIVDQPPDGRDLPPPSSVDTVDGGATVGSGVAPPPVACPADPMALLAELDRAKEFAKIQRLLRLVQLIDPAKLPPELRAKYAALFSTETIDAAHRLEGYFEDVGRPPALVARIEELKAQLDQFQADIYPPNSPQEINRVKIDRLYHAYFDAGAELHYLKERAREFANPEDVLRAGGAPDLQAKIDAINAEYKDAIFERDAFFGDSVNKVLANKFQEFKNAQVELYDLMVGRVSDPQLVANVHNEARGQLAAISDDLLDAAERVNEKGILYNQNFRRDVTPSSRAVSNSLVDIAQRDVVAAEDAVKRCANIVEPPPGGGGVGAGGGSGVGGAKTGGGGTGGGTGGPGPGDGTVGTPGGSGVTCLPDTDAHVERLLGEFEGRLADIQRKMKLPNSDYQALRDIVGKKYSYKPQQVADLAEFFKTHPGLERELNAINNLGVQLELLSPCVECAPPGSRLARLAAVAGEHGTGFGKGFIHGLLFTIAFEVIKGHSFAEATQAAFEPANLIIIAGFTALGATIAAPVVAAVGSIMMGLSVVDLINGGIEARLRADQHVWSVSVVHHYWKNLDYNIVSSAINGGYSQFLSQAASLVPQEEIEAGGDFLREAFTEEMKAKAARLIDETPNNQQSFFTPPRTSLFPTLTTEEARKVLDSVLTLRSDKRKAAREADAGKRRRDLLGYVSSDLKDATQSDQVVGDFLNILPQDPAQRLFAIYQDINLSDADLSKKYSDLAEVLQLGKLAYGDAASFLRQALERERGRLVRSGVKPAASSTQLKQCVQPAVCSVGASKNIQELFDLLNPGYGLQVR